MPIISESNAVVPSLQFVLVLYAQGRKLDLDAELLANYVMVAKGEKATN